MAMEPGLQLLLNLLPNSGHLNQAIADGQVVIQPLNAGPEFDMVQDYVRDTDNGFPSCKGKLVKPVQVYSVDIPKERQTFESKYGGQENRMYLWHPLMMNWEADVLWNGIQYKEAHFHDTVSIAAHYAYKHQTGKIGTLLLCEVALDEKLTMCENWLDYKQSNGELKYVSDEPVVYYMGWFNRVPECRTVSGVLVPTDGLQINQKAFKTEANFYADYYIRQLDRIKIKYLVVLNGYTDERNNRPPKTDSVNDDVLSQ